VIPLILDTILHRSTAITDRGYRGARARTHLLAAPARDVARLPV